jgi:uracil-DNA glycosylase family 4
MHAKKGAVFEDPDLLSCRQCPRLVLHREEVARVKRRAFQDQDYWGRPVATFGDPRARLVIVGLAPAAHGANRTGRMFTGDRSGDFLYAALHRAGLASQPASVARDDGLTLRDVAITAPVRCAPPGNRPTRDEIEACEGFLVRDLSRLIRARVYLCLGRIGHESFLRVCRGSHPGLSPGKLPFSHGAVHTLPDGKWLVDSYHVSQQNTFTGRLTPESFDRVLCNARELAQGDEGRGTKS